MKLNKRQMVRLHSVEIRVRDIANFFTVLNDAQGLRDMPAETLDETGRRLRELAEDVLMTAGELLNDN